MTYPSVLLFVLGLAMALPFALIVVVLAVACCKASGDADERPAPEDPDGRPPAFFDRDGDVPFDPEAPPYPLAWRQSQR